MRCLQVLGVFLALIVGLACDDAGYVSPWRSQLQADSPCYRVNLLDGLSTASTAELHDTFACLNHNGHFRPLEPVVDRFDALATTQRPLGVELAHMVVALSEVDVDVFGLAGVLLDALNAPDRPFDELLSVALELIHGTPAPQIEAGRIDRHAAPTLAAAPLSRACPVVPRASRVLVQHEDAPLAWLGGVLADDETRRWVRLLQAFTTASDPAVEEPVHQVLPQLGEAIRAANTPGNDRWSGASGNSLRDLSDRLLLGGRPAIEELAPELHTLLTDDALLSSVETLLLSLEGGGRLPGILPQITWMASVNRNGNTLRTDEVSALRAILRVLERGNQPMSCSFNVGFGQLTVSLGNLALPLLEILADAEPGFVVDVTGLISQLLGGPFTRPLVDQLAQSGACPVLTPSFIADLEAFEVLQRPEAEDLLVAFTGVLRALRDAESNRLPLLIELVESMLQLGLVDPLEEAIRDLGPTPLAESLVRLLPPLISPSTYGMTGGDVFLPRLRDAFPLLAWVVAPQEGGGTGWTTLAPLITPALSDDDTWLALRALADLLRAEGSTLGDGMRLLPRVLALDPDLELLGVTARLLQSPGVTTPALHMLGEGSLLAEACRAESVHASDPRTPQGFVSDLIVHDVVRDLLRMVDTLVGALRSP